MALTFNFSTSRSNTDPASGALQQVEQDFRGLSQAVDASLSVWAELLIKDISMPPALFLVGPPAGGKTTAINIMKIPSETYYVDTFTPAGFVSSFQGATSSKLNDIDLIKKIAGKLFLTPEMNATWNQSKEKLAENIGIITRVLDGQGLVRHSGTHGTRGYSGPIMFAWLAATTPLRKRLWPIIASLGPRIYFYPVDNQYSTSEIIGMIKNQVSHDERVRRCREEVARLMAKMKGQFPQGFEWDKQGDDEELISRIYTHAKITAALRGYVDTEYNDDGNYTIGAAQKEDPSRATQWYYNLARGHALIHGRTRIQEEDLHLIKMIAFASAPYERVRAWQILVEERKMMRLEDFVKKIRLSKKSAIRIVRTLESLGLVELLDDPTGGHGRPPLAIEALDLS